MKLSDADHNQIIKNSGPGFKKPNIPPETEKSITEL